jgi:hypothetical protein
MADPTSARSADRGPIPGLASVAPVASAGGFTAHASRYERVLGLILWIGLFLVLVVTSV